MTAGVDTSAAGLLEISAPDAVAHARPAYLRMVETMGEIRLPALVAPNLGHISMVEAILMRVDRAAATVDWGDGEDYGPEFLTPTLERREIAIGFVRTLAVLAEELYSLMLPLPEFSPAANGGVDIHWEVGEERELLLGVRPSGDLASFFGETSSGSSIKGLLSLRQSNSFLVGWLLDSV